MRRSDFGVAMGAALLLASAAASAFHCPVDMKKIDARLAENPSLSAEQMSEVEDLRARGEALHEAGNHGEAVDVLGEAMRILGIE